MFSKKRISALLLLCVAYVQAIELGKYDTSHGQGNLDNTAVASTVEDAMVNLPDGKYKFQNIET